MAQTKVQLLMPNLGDVIDFDSSTLFMDGADNRVGIRNTNPQYELDVTGTVNATNFRGNISVGTIDDWITHTGDTNTKFGFPSNDTFTVETGGSERIRFDASGKTFIHGTGATGSNNTSTRLPNGNTLNIHGTSSNDGISIVRYSADFGAFGINIGKSNNSTFGTNTLVTNGEELGHITFYGADGTDFNHAAQITALVNGTPSDGTDMPGALSFRTSAEGSATPTERLRIDSSGRVLVSTTTEGHGNADELTLSYNNTGVSGGDQGRCGLTIRSGQNTSSVMQNGYIYFSDGTSGGNEYRGVVGYNHNSDYLYFSSAATERMRITGDGPHLLLGGTSDVNEITESSANAGMVIGGTGYGNGGLAIINSTTGAGRIYFGDATGSNAARQRGQINYYHSGDYMMFATAGSERLRIDSSGNVLIGTTSATSEFTVRGGGTVAAFEGTGGSGSIMIKDVDDGTLAYALVDGGNFDIQTSGSSYSTKLRIDTSGYVTAPAKRQAAFCARVSGTISNISANGILIYNTDNHGSNGYQAFDTGGNYNTSDGKYTCPVSGVYYFEAQAMTQGWADGNSMQDLLVMKSNRGTVSNPRQRRSYFRTEDDANGYYTNSVSGLYNATAGDTVWVIVTAGCSVSNLSYSYFSGFLVG